MPVVIGVVVVVSARSVAFGPAETAALSRIVPSHQLSQASAQNGARTFAAGLAGPPLGGLLYQVGRALPLLLDLVVYVLSYLAVAAIKTPLSHPATPDLPMTRRRWSV